MIIEGFNIREASIEDTDFLAYTIIEAEKSGTSILSWTTLFGLSEDEAIKYVRAMLLEEIDGCELSISSFFVAEAEGKAVAALSAWIEGSNNESSSQLKGNLLSYFLPRECIERALNIYPLVQELHIEYLPGTIQKGAGYVVEEYRNKNLFQILTHTIIERYKKVTPAVSQVYTQIFDCNVRAIRANEKAGFEIVMEKSSNNPEILKYLPSNKKYLMRRELK